MNSTKLQNGFTLIELMITVAILGVLAGIAIPAYNGYITTAKMSEATNNLAALKLAEEEFYLENNSYFSGKTSDSTLSNASGGLWTASKGSDGYNFDYVVTTSSGWTATATPMVGSSLEGQAPIIWSK